MSERSRMEKKLVAAIIDTVYNDKDKNYKKILATVPGVKSVAVDLISLSMGDKVWELPELKEQDMDSFMAWGTPIYFCELHRARLDTKKYTLTLGRLGNTFEYVIELENQWRESYPDPAFNQLELFNE